MKSTLFGFQLSYELFTAKWFKGVINWLLVNYSESFINWLLINCSGGLINREVRGYL